jgi:serine/threonine protein kinase
MEEIDKLEHFTISRRRDGSLWELGRGAMGVTYKALDTNLQSEVALKAISAQYLDSEPARQRFLREARAAASLRHPNVATVFHLGKVDGRIYYAMEYVNGETVERRVQREGPLHPLLALRIVRQITGALVAAGREKLVHRDIEPSNIMLALEYGDDQLLVKVIDFGLAKSFISSAHQSGTLTVGGFVGTPHFASPEQLEEKEIDVRSDICSLGATLWYMLTGRPPFEGALARVIYQHIGEPLPSNILQQFPPALRALLEKMLAKRPEDRFQTPQELKTDLDALLKDLEDKPVTVSATSAPRSKGVTSVSGISVGHLIRNRYLILNRSPFDPHTFEAEDLQSDEKKRVALRFLPLACANDPRQLAEIHHEIERLRETDHPNLLRVNALESYDSGLFITGEWAPGFTLQELLRSRRQLTWQGTIPIAKPLANVLDFAAQRQLLRAGPSLREVFLETPDNSLTSGESTPQDLDWSACKLKVDALSLERPSESRFVEPAETVVDGQPIADVLRSPVQLLASLLHDLMGGVKSLLTNGGKAVRLNPLPNLSEAGNIVLRNGVLDPTQFGSAADFLEKLESAEAEKAELLRPVALVAAPISSTPGITTSVVDGRATLAESSNPAAPVQPDFAKATSGKPASPDQMDSSDAIETVAGAHASPYQPPERQHGFGRIAVGLFVVLGLCALAGFFIVQSSRTGSSGHPLVQASPQSGQGTLEVSPIPQTSPLVSPGAAQETAPASDQSVGQAQSSPAAPTAPALVQESPAAAKSLDLSQTRGENLELGTRNPQLGTSNSAIAEENSGAPSSNQPSWAPQFGDVLLKSDPPGATIYQGGTELEKTPLNISFPAEPIELTSQFGTLAPVQQRFTADPKKSTVVEFKHEYGSLAIESDQPDTNITIDGKNTGNAPFTQWLSPGRHKLIAHVPGRDAQTRELDVQAQDVRTVRFGLSQPADVSTPAAVAAPAATGTGEKPALLTVPGLKAETANSPSPQTAPRSTPALSPGVRPAAQSQAANERVGRLLQHQPRVLQGASEPGSSSGAAYSIPGLPYPREL